MRTVKRVRLWQGLVYISKSFEKCDFTEWLCNYTIPHSFSLVHFLPAGTPQNNFHQDKNPVQLLALNTCIPSVMIRFCFSGIPNHALCTLRRIDMNNKQIQLLNVWNHLWGLLLILRSSMSTSFYTGKMGPYLR